LATVEAQIAYLVDLEALRDVLLRYCRGIDRCDEELLLSAYHPDAYDDHAGFFQGKAVDFVRLVMGEYKDKPPTQHVVTNARFEIDGDVAFGESYVVMRSADPDGPHPAAFARYVDRFERRDGEWRISYRRLVHEWDGTGTDGYGGSRRDRLDPSYTIVHEEPPV
jgi:ketosteroid isomerase-like protein